MQPAEERAKLKGIAKKIMCPDHNFKYVFRCEYPTCESPFICGNLDCIDSHFHEDKATISRFHH